MSGAATELTQADFAELLTYDALTSPTRFPLPPHPGRAWTATKACEIMNNPFEHRFCSLCSLNIPVKHQSTPNLLPFNPAHSHACHGPLCTPGCAELQIWRKHLFDIFRSMSSVINYRNESDVAKALPRILQYISHEADRMPYSNVCIQPFMMSYSRMKLHVVEQLTDDFIMSCSA